MAGSLGSSDIEDVVSSVRRLVSIDARPRAVSRELGADRLILTPSLRIVSEPVEPEPVALDVSPAVTVEAASGTDATPGDVVSGRDQSAADALAGAIPAEVPAPVAAVAEQSVAEDTPAATRGKGAALHLVVDDWDEEVWSEADLPPAEPVAEAIESVVSEPDAIDPHVPDPLTVASDDAEPTVPHTDVQEIWADDLSDLAEPLATAGTASLHGIGDAVLPRAQTVELTDPDGNPLTILDEAALQDMVRQLIREELQGNLGERITRNVRKLVRAEINRALTARALD